MVPFGTRHLPERSDVIAPDGSEVRVLLGLSAGGMAHFRLPAGAISLAVAHRTVEEIWYIVSGHGQMWRKADGHEDLATLSAGVCLTIPLGVQFQFRANADGPLDIIAITMPPWPGTEEAILVPGRWTPTVTTSPP